MRHTLLTGFPGFLATRLAERLASASERWTFLVEERFAEKARAAAKRIAQAAGKPAESFEIVSGDITLPGLGLGARDHQRLTSEVDTVLHFAAIYDLAVPAELAERVNVGGTAQMNDFVRALERLDRYHYVSTYAVAGKRRGIVREAELEHDAGFNNHYEETKYRAEISVRNLAAEGLPVVIYRPAVVVGSSKDGSTPKFDGPYMLLKVMRRLPWPVNRFNVGSPGVRFQMVPVDFVIEAIATLSARADAAGKTFHLTDPEPHTTEQIFDLFSQALYRARSWIRVPTSLTALVAGSGIAEPLGLQRQSAPYFEHQATFDCVNTLDALDGSGVSVPRLETYADQLIAYFLTHENDR